MFNLQRYLNIHNHLLFPRYQKAIGEGPFWWNNHGKNVLTRLTPIQSWWYGRRHHSMFHYRSWGERMKLSDLNCAPHTGCRGKVLNRRTDPKMDTKFCESFIITLIHILFFIHLVFIIRFLLLFWVIFFEDPSVNHFCDVGILIQDYSFTVISNLCWADILTAGDKIWNAWTLRFWSWLDQWGVGSDNNVNYRYKLLFTHPACNRLSFATQ